VIAKRVLFRIGQEAQGVEEAEELINMKRRVMTACLSVLFLSLPLSAIAAPGDLADAVMAGDLAAVEALLAEGADVNDKQLNGSTALHWAVYHDDLELAQRFIEDGANVQATTREGITPLHLASLYGNPDMVSSLLEAGADASSRGPAGETMLMLAARNGNPETVHLLIDAGADVTAFETIRGTTALMWAVERKNPEAVSVLLEAGADVSAMSARAGTPRPYMSNRVGAETVRQVQERIRREALGLPPAEPAGGRGGRGGGGQGGGAFAGGFGGGGFGGGGQGGQNNAAEDDAEGEDDGPVAGLSGGDGGGLTALIFAAREGDLQSARLLIEAGADVNQTTYFGWTPLLTATYNRNYELGGFLIESGADVNMVNGENMSPLYFATDNRNIEGGDYPVPRADMDHLQFIELLLENGADVDHQVTANTLTRTIFTMQWFQERGATAFIRAGQSSDTALMELLLEYGADPLAETDHGDNALSASAGIGWVDGVTFERSPAANVEAVRMLLDLGLDPNIANDDGRTPLMGAAFKGNIEVVETLLDAGARLDIRDFGSRDTDKSNSALAGHTWQPLDYAEGLVRVGVQSAPSHPEVARLMRDRMAEEGLPVPDENRVVDSICIVAICMGEEVDELLGLTPPEAPQP
jgi:ankyrin repeat protein